MTRQFYRSPNGKPTTDLASLCPDVIGPEFLSAEDLAARGVFECHTVMPETAWWQTLGEPVLNTEVTPHEFSWAVLERPLVEVRELAWRRIKDQRKIRRSAGVEFEFADGIGHIQVRDEDITNLLAIHAAATTALMMANTTELPFTDRENNTRRLSPAVALQVTMAAFGHSSVVHVISQQRRQACAAATTVAEVVAASQWPEG